MLINTIRKGYRVSLLEKQNSIAHNIDPLQFASARSSGSL